MFFLVVSVGYSADNPSAPQRAAGTAETRSSSPLSTHISAAIRAGLPAYSPPPPPTTTTIVPGSTEDIVFLSKVVVNGSKVPGEGEWQMLSKVGHAAFLKKRFPGFVVPGADPLTENTPNYASQMQRDEVRKENLRALEDTVDLCRVAGDLKRSKELKEELQRALIRGYDWRTERLDRSYNNDRR